MCVVRSDVPFFIIDVCCSGQMYLSLKPMSVVQDSCTFILNRRLLFRTDVPCFKIDVCCSRQMYHSLKSVSVVQDSCTFL